MRVIGVPAGNEDRSHRAALALSRDRIVTREDGEPLDSHLAVVQSAFSAGELLAVAVADLDRDLTAVVRQIRGSGSDRADAPVLIVAFERDSHDRTGHNGPTPTRPSIHIDAWSSRILIAETNNVA